MNMAIMCGAHPVASNILTKTEAKSLTLLPNDIIVNRGNEYRSTHSNNLGMFTSKGYQEVK